VKRRDAIKSMIIACSAPVFIASGLMPVKMVKRESGIYTTEDIRDIIPELRHINVSYDKKRNALIFAWKKEVFGKVIFKRNKLGNLYVKDIK